MLIACWQLSTAGMLTAITPPMGPMMWMGRPRRFAAISQFDGPLADQRITWIGSPVVPRKLPINSDADSFGNIPSIEIATPSNDQTGA